MNLTKPRVKMLLASAETSQLVGYELDGKHCLPWRIPSDLKWFKAITMGSTVVVGRHTWESFGSRPLPGRKHIVVSNHPLQHESDQVEFMPIDHCIAHIKNSNEMFSICGGPMLYSRMLQENVVDVLYLTRVDYKGTVPQGAEGAYYRPDVEELESKGWLTAPVKVSADRSRDECPYTIQMYLNCEANCDVSRPSSVECRHKCLHEVHVVL